MIFEGFVHEEIEQGGLGVKFFKGLMKPEKGVMFSVPMFGEVFKACWIGSKCVSLQEN